MQGANIRPVGDARRGYGSATARETMRRLQRLGVNTVGILMEGRMQDLQDRDIRFRRSDLEAVRQALLDANELGLASVLIPHLYLDDGSWRGDLTLEDPDAADAWWRAYGDFILAAARVAESGAASVLSVGVELKALSYRSETRERMAELVSKVRTEFQGLLTYSANWDEAEQVKFWNLVDRAGVNGYYPLLPEPVRGAEAVAARLENLAALSERPVLVLEVGYRSSPMPYVRPWEWPEDIHAAVDLQAQAHVWAAVLSAWPQAKGVEGIMFWVVPTDPDDPASEPRHGFNPLNKPAENVIARAFGGTAAPSVAGSRSDTGAAPESSGAREFERARFTR